jgi:hypothetical protein
MSHLKERAERDCLNCNAIVQGRYCHICGQENVEPKETVWHLINHFFQDITHFDGKFFSSLKLLIFRPGFLSREYLLGRRASYLNPIRFYVFTSAIFFLIFFWLYHFDPDKDINITGDVNHVPISVIKKMDPAKYRAFVDTLVKNDPELKFAYDRDIYLKHLDSVALSSGTIKITPAKYTSRKSYDSALAHGKDHNWIERQLVYKQIELNEKYKGNSKAFISTLINSLLHSIPQMLFITLPLFALWLKLMYARRRQYYYVDHAIFTVHLFVFIFILELVIMGLNKIADATAALNWFKYISGILTLGLFFYIYKAMRNFYRQGRGKTILKFLILLLFSLVMISILFVAFTFLSFFKI